MLLKRFRVLTTKYRHNLDKHTMCMEAVVPLSQLNIIVKELLFPIE